MDKLNLNKHISGQFNAELEGVLNQVLVMGGLVEQQLTDAITAIHEQNMTMARQIVANDHKVNALEVQIDEECTRIIAKRQPAASDLRLVLAIIKTITDLERIGDVAKRIGMMLLDNANKKAAAAGVHGEHGPAYRAHAARIPRCLCPHGCGSGH